MSQEALRGQSLPELEGRVAPTSRKTLLLAIIGLLIAFGVPELGLPQRIFGDTAIGPRIGREIVWIGLAALLIWWVTRIERKSLASIGLIRPTWRSIVWGIAGAILLLATLMISFAIIIPSLGLAQNMEATRAVVDVPLWLFLATPIVAGITEEIVYRGYAIERLTLLTGRRWLAAAVAGATFIASHAAWGSAQLVPVAFATFILTGLYLWRRDLPSVMIAHAVANLIGFALARLQT